MTVIYPDLTHRPFNMTVERTMQPPPAALFEAWTRGLEAGSPLPARRSWSPR
jgi:hypothetical protein